MLIFDSPISDKLIGGLSKLETHYSDSKSEVWYSFDVYLPQYKVSFVSDRYSSTDADQSAKEAWLDHFRQVKQNVLQLLSPKALLATNKSESVERCFTNLIGNLDKLLSILEPANAVEQNAANLYISNVRNQAGTLKQYAIAL